MAAVRDRGTHQSASGTCAERRTALLGARKQQLDLAILDVLQLSDSADRLALELRAANVLLRDARGAGHVCLE